MTTSEYARLLADAEDIIARNPSVKTICNCECHNPEVVMMHIIACCHACEICKKKILIGRKYVHMILDHKDL